MCVRLDALTEDEISICIAGNPASSTVRVTVPGLEALNGSSTATTNPVLASKSETAHARAGLPPPLPTQTPIP